MKPERWRRIEEIYYRALDLDPAQRETFLDQSCAEDASLRREVDRLIRDQAEAEPFIESPAVEVAARALFSADPVGSVDAPEIAPADVAGTKAGHPERAPWWMYVIAAAFLICAAVRHYAHFTTQFESPGYALKLVRDKNGVPNGVEIKAVQPGSQAEKAGLKPGDIILFSKSDGWITGFRPSLGSEAYYWKPGRTFRMEIVRGEERRMVSLTVRRMPWSYWLTRSNERPAFASIIISILELLLALMIVFRRPYDAAARWGALFLAIVAIVISYGTDLVYGWHGVIQSLGMIGWLIVLLPSICDTLFVSAGITFFTLFPRKLFKERWIWALVWLPALAILPLAVFSDHLPVYTFPRFLPDWYSNAAKILGFACWFAMVAVLIMNYRGLRSLNERRRIRVIVAGAMITLAAYLPIAAAIHFPDVAFFKRLVGPPYNLLLVLCCLGCAFPIAMTYAILRHRVFDLGVMMRQGVRYAAARNFLLSLVPLIVIAFAGDLLLHHDQPLGEILTRRAAVYVVLAGGALLLHRNRKTWLEALDRRFFRERYDAQRVLRKVIEEIREARSFEKVAPRVTLQIEASLHPEFAAILVRHPGDPDYGVFAARERIPPPIGANSKLMALVRVLGKPIEISQSQTGWPWSLLPQEESDFLRRARLEWLYPINLTEGRPEALLAVGPKRSEEPYSQEDQELLEGITSSLALLLEQSPISISDSQGFKECPECGICYDSDSNSCEREGATLTPLPFSRWLMDRYRFEQRLGAGGMGVVYQALDTELERQVAVKLIRPELTASAAAATRFKQEAKAAASFTHPNVVTVHDYGVSESRRAYIVMELLRGATLRQALNKKGRLRAEHATKILGGVCTAVGAAHRKRLLHRDLKPENIFLADSDGAETVKILDFGVVKRIADAESSTLSVGQTGPGLLVGTLKYMSPEELHGKPAAEGWDLWALAVVTYEMLTGAHPFGGSTMIEVRNAILDGRMTPLQAHLPEAPASWQQFFDRALSSDPASRPQSALQLLHDFNQSISGGQSPVSP